MTTKKGELSGMQIAEYREAFHIFDENNDGFITPTELSAVMRALGQNPTSHDIEEWMRRTESERPGLVSFDDFLTLMSRHIQESNAQDEITDAFRVFDREGNGKITILEFTHILKDLGDPLSDKAINEMIHEAQPSATGEIDYISFVQRMLAS
jgi:Ca2+-binding EF-hand superfamily protein